ncbi:MAG: hypothetical protein WCY37_04065 [Candidatus Dojkabacteria bacterium]
MQTEEINNQDQGFDLKGKPMPPQEAPTPGFYDAQPNVKPTREEKRASRKKERKGGCLRGCLIVVIILLFLLALLTGAAYYGYKKVIGSMQPVDLGIEYTREDYTGLMDKIGLDAPPSALCIDCPTPTFSDPHEVEVTVSNEEASATFEYVNQYLENASISGTQIKMNDGSAELTTNLDYEGLSFPVYMTGSVSKVNERTLGGNIYSIKVGQVAVPDYVVATVEEFLLNTANSKLMSAGDSVRIDMLDITSDGLKFSGLLPGRGE